MTDKKNYYITDTVLSDAVKVFTKNLMKGQKGWKKNKNLDLIEFQIEGIIKNNLHDFHGIKFEE